MDNRDKMFPKHCLDVKCPLAIAIISIHMAFSALSNDAGFSLPRAFDVYKISHKDGREGGTREDFAHQQDSLTIPIC